MAHYSYASPDGKSVLVVEMSGAHAFTQPCRLVPFDGSSAGRQVGPQGTCLSAAWSPDGRWMYFGAVVGGSWDLWRQRFPDKSRTDERVRPARGGRHCAGAGRPVHRDIGRHAPERRLDSRRGRRASNRVGRLRLGSQLSPGRHTCVLSGLRGTGGWPLRAGFQRQLICARWTSRRGRVTLCCQASRSPTT